MEDSENNEAATLCDEDEAESGVEQETSPESAMSKYPNTYLGDVLKDFNGLFQEKLKFIEDASKQAVDTRTNMLMMERRNEVLEQWAKDVCSQNMLLVHTVEELEEEANRKVKTLQAKINATTNLARSHMEMIQQYEKQVEELLNEQSIAEKKYEMLTYDHMEVSKCYKTIQQRMKTLENDNDSIKSLICRVRDMGVWDVNGLQLQPSTYDLLFGLYPNLAGSEVQTVFTREKARNIIETEVKSKEMEQYILELKDAKKEVDVALDEKEKTVITLEAEVKSLSTVLKHYQGQCDDLKKALEDTQDRLIHLTNKSNMESVETKEELTSAMCRRDQDIKDMLNALRDLKTQLNKACDERQSAIYEAKMLKRELGDRTSEMLEMRNILQIIQNEAECTRSAVQNVQEKQDHLSILKEQVHSYQEKYEQAQNLLSSKSEIIQSLQQQMSLLHDKVMHLETQSSFSPTSFDKRDYNYNKTDSVLTGSSTRNLIPSIIDNSVSAALKRFELTAKERVAQMFEANKNANKPAWTTHFTKESTLNDTPSSSVTKIRTAPISDSKTIVSKAVVQKEKIGKQSPLNKKAPTDKSANTKKTTVNKQSSSIEKTDRQNSSKKNSGPKIELRIEKKDKGLKLPKISLADWMQSADTDKDRSTSRPKSSGGLGNEHLPRLGEKPDNKAKTRNPLHNVPKTSTENPMAQRSSLHNLMEQATKSSTQQNSVSHINGSPYTNTRAVTSNSQPKLRRSRSSPKIAEKKEKHLTRSANRKTVKDRCSINFRLRPTNGTRSKSSSAPSDAITFSKTKLNIKKSSELDLLLPSASWEAEDLLQQLPQQSNEMSIKKWIASSSKTCLELNKKMKAARSKYSLSGHSTPSNSSHKSLRRRRSSTSKINQDREPPIYTLEDEWDKTMAKVTRRNSAMEDTHLAESTASDNSAVFMNGKGNQGVSNGFGDASEEDSFEPHGLTLVNSNNNIIKLEDQPEAIKNSVVNKLKEEFSIEKSLMEKNYQEELRNKDIEITMQKLSRKLEELKKENEGLLSHAETLDERISQYTAAFAGENEETGSEYNNLESVKDYSTLSFALEEIVPLLEIENLIATISELQSSKLKAEQEHFHLLEIKLKFEYSTKISAVQELISELEGQLAVVKGFRRQMAALFEERKSLTSLVSEFVQTDEFTIQYKQSEMAITCRDSNGNMDVAVAEENLLELKNAYNSNEEILQNKISHYAEHVEKLRSQIVSKGLESNPEKKRDELIDNLKQSAEYFKEKNEILSCEKERLDIQIKSMKNSVNKSVKVCGELRTENTLLRNTVSSLSSNIEQLTDENEKLLHQIHQQHKANPCTTKANNRKLEKGCGDTCKCEHSDSSEFSSSGSASASFLLNPLSMSSGNIVYASGKMAEEFATEISSDGPASYMKSRIPRPSTITTHDRN